MEEKKREKERVAGENRAGLLCHLFSKMAPGEGSVVDGNRVTTD